MKNLHSALVCFLGASALAACSSVTTPSSSNGAGGAGGAGGSAGEGGAAPVACVWTGQSSNATCPAGPCPIVFDNELACDDVEFAAPGLRVAPAPDATWLATSSSNDRIVYRIANGQEERQEGVPKSFTRTAISLALAGDGAVQLVADTTLGGSDYVGGVTHVAYAGGAWTSSVVFDRDDKYTPVIDFEVTPDGKPFVWFVSDAPDVHTLATPDGQGGWTLTPQKPQQRFTLAGDGSIVGVTLELTPMDAYRLHALIGGADTLIGSPLGSSNFGVPDLALAAPPPSMPSGLLFGAAVAASDGIHVFQASAGVPAKESLVPDIAPPVGSCVTPPNDPTCTGTCQNTGAGMERGAFALAWTGDGTAWLAYVTTTIEQTLGYSLQGDPGIEFCVGNVLEDKSKGTLHLLRVPQNGSAPVEVLTMPIARPGGGDAFTDYYSSGRFLDLRGFGKDLALGVRTGWIAGPHAVRLLRIDTTKL